MTARVPSLTRRALAHAAAASVVAVSAPAKAADTIRIGTYGGAGCTGVPEVAAYEKWLGRPLDVVLDFLEKETWKGMVDEAGWMSGCWREAGRKNLIVSVPMLVSEGQPTLAQGARGAYDQHFVALGRKLVENSYGNSVIRIGWEFNGGWYAWTARGNAPDFKAYWKRIALAMRGVPGAQFRFDWSATTVDGPTVDAYPGDDVVDIVGLDIYNQAWPLIEDPARRWKSLLNHEAGLIWHRDFARAHGKPRSFPEWGTGTRPDGHGGGDDPLYIRNMLAWMHEGGPVDYACYWNYRASDYDAKVTDGHLPEAAKALHAGLQRTA